MTNIKEKAQIEGTATNSRRPPIVPCVSHKPQSRSIQSQTRRYQCRWINDNQLWHPLCHLIHNYRECQSPHSSFELDQSHHHKRDTHFSICISATLFNVSHVPAQSLYFNSDRFKSFSFDRAIAFVFASRVSQFIVLQFSSLCKHESQKDHGLAGPYFKIHSYASFTYHWLNIDFFSWSRFCCNFISLASDAICLSRYEFMSIALTAMVFLSSTRFYLPLKPPDRVVVLESSASLQWVSRWRHLRYIPNTFRCFVHSPG